jgi:hypothetical protein
MATPYASFPKYVTRHVDRGVSGMMPSTWRATDPALGLPN